jgi:release factor glutamine methyltransferase
VPRGVVRTAARLLRPGGLLVMEHAEVQGEGTRALALGQGAFEAVETGTDLTGRDRMLVARRSGGGVVRDSPS